MSTEYRVRIDRTACEGVFACLVRDDRFVEDQDGLATIDGAESHGRAEEGEAVIAQFVDDQIDDARLAASACPVDAIDVTVIDDG